MTWVADKRERVVLVSDGCMSSDAEETLITYSLGSCVGLALYDPVARVGGMSHSMLPVSSLDRAKAAANPWMFTDTATALLLQRLFEMGARRTNLVARVAGAATAMQGEQVFRVGSRNLAVVRKVLWKNDILLAAEDVGGTEPRSLFLEMATGRTYVRKRGRTYDL